MFCLGAESLLHLLTDKKKKTDDMSEELNDLKSKFAM